MEGPLKRPPSPRGWLWYPAILSLPFFAQPSGREPGLAHAQSGQVSSWAMSSRTSSGRVLLYRATAGGLLLRRSEGVRLGLSGLSWSHGATDIGKSLYVMLDLCWTSIKITFCLPIHRSLNARPRPQSGLHLAVWRFFLADCMQNTIVKRPKQSQPLLRCCGSF